MGKVTLVGYGVVAALWLAWYTNRWLGVDRCLDLGGRWNYQVGTCEGSPYIDESGRLIKK